MEKIHYAYNWLYMGSRGITLDQSQPATIISFSHYLDAYGCENGMKVLMQSLVKFYTQTTKLEGVLGSLYPVTDRGIQH